MTLRLRPVFLCLFLFMSFQAASENILDECMNYTERQLLYNGEKVEAAEEKARRICELEIKQNKSYQQKKVFDGFLKKIKKREIANAETYLCEFDSDEKLSFRRMVDNIRYDFGKRNRKSIFHEGYSILEEGDQYLSLYDNKSWVFASDTKQKEYISTFIIINKKSKEAKQTVVDLMKPKRSIVYSGKCKVLKNKKIDGNFDNLGFGDYK